MNVDDAAKMVGYYRYVFGSMEGQKVLEDMGIRCGVNAGHSADGEVSYFAGPTTPPLTRAYRDGQQDFYKSVEVMATQQEER